MENVKTSHHFCDNDTLRLMKNSADKNKAPHNAYPLQISVARLQELHPFASVLSSHILDFFQIWQNSSMENTFMQEAVCSSSCAMTFHAPTFCICMFYTYTRKTQLNTTSTGHTKCMVATEYNSIPFSHITPSSPSLSLMLRLSNNYTVNA